MPKVQHKIFRPNLIPAPLERRSDWDYRDGWAIIINGEVLYGARTKEDIERNLWLNQN